jgi:ppGpp synthetase/RelA/SpoT-type nucleotidyltranferase
LTRSDPVSFGRKASKPAKEDPDKPMYPSPLEQITDLAAIRIITFFPRTIEDIDTMLREEFQVTEQIDKGKSLLEEERFGYKSLHYLVNLTATRTSLPEYQRFAKSTVEIQVRTILQHAWAEIEHDIQYKSSATIPRDIKRRFMSLAGLLEIADREFQAIQDADRELRSRAERQISAGELRTVEITPSALKAYLDKRLGPDGRMTEFSYDWSARVLLRLGFTSLEQVDQCIASYDDDEITRIIGGYRQGQLTRFEFMLLAGMGDKFIVRHPWSSYPWFRTRNQETLRRFADNKIPIGDYDPLPPTQRSEDEV